MRFATNALHLWLRAFVAKRMCATSAPGWLSLAAKVAHFQTATDTSLLSDVKLPPRATASGRHAEVARNDELAARHRAITLRLAGRPVKAVCTAVGRSEVWFHKWWGRYLQAGPEGLYDLTRAHHHVAQRNFNGWFQPRLFQRLFQRPTDLR